MLVIKCWATNNPRIYGLKQQKSTRIFTTLGVQEFRDCLAGWSGLRFLMRLQVRCWLGLQYPCQKCSCTWLHGCPICADCWLKTLLFFPHGHLWRAAWVSSQHGSWPPPEWVMHEIKPETVIPFMTWAQKSNICFIPRQDLLGRDRDGHQHLQSLTLRDSKRKKVPLSKKFWWKVPGLTPIGHTCDASIWTNPCGLEIPYSDWPDLGHTSSPRAGVEWAALETHGGNEGRIVFKGKSGCPYWTKINSCRWEK